MQSWDGLQAYAFPPFGLLHRVQSKVWQPRGLELTLVAPFWPQHSWFPDLLVAVPVFLPRRKDLLRQLHFHRFHQNLCLLRLTAFRISSDPPEPLASLQQWLVNLPPRSLFVSPRAPRPLSKNALSFFIRDVIAESYSSANLSLTSISSSLSASFLSSSSSSSLVHAHGVQGVASFWAFLRNAPLSVLEATTWSSASVFTSFYLSDVQFSSSLGFSLGPVVAAGAVV